MKSGLFARLFVVSISVFFFLSVTQPFHTALLEKLDQFELPQFAAVGGWMEDFADARMNGFLERLKSLASRNTPVVPAPIAQPAGVPVQYATSTIIERVREVTNVYHPSQIIERHFTVTQGGVSTADLALVLEEAKAYTTKAINKNMDSIDHPGVSDLFGSLTAGDLLIVDTDGEGDTLSAGNTGTVLQIVDGMPTWVATSTLGFLEGTSLDTSAEIAALVIDETGTGELVFNTDPLLHGFRSDASSTIAELTVSGDLTVLGDSLTLGANTADTLIVNASVDSDLIPTVNATYDLGSPSYYWNDAYFDTITVNNISAASTSIAGTQSSTFTLNSDNASADAEDMDLIFFRGVVVPNALLSWRSAPARFEFNQPLFIQNQSSNTTTIPTLSLRGSDNQTGNILEVASSTGVQYLTVSTNGRIGIGTNTPASTVDIAGTDAIRIPVGTTAQRPNTPLVGQVRYNTTSAQFEGYGASGAWQGLGGVVDIDQDTYITAEQDPDDDTLRFYTAGNERFSISNTGNVSMGTVIGGVWNGSVIGDAYITKSGDWTGTFDGQDGTYYLSRANHTGTQTASTISDFAAAARATLSEGVTGLDYDSATGVLSLTTGHIIPLSASTTAWNSFFNTPSSRITAGSGLSWTGNTLNCVTANGSTLGCLSSADWTTFMGKVSSSSIDTSAELAALVSDETGSGALVFANAPTLTGNVTLGTVTAGTWNGSVIGDAYLTKSGDWTGTFDGLEGSAYALDSDIGTTIQAYDAELADLADGIIATDFVNTANPWADNEVSDILTISGGTIGSNNVNGTWTTTGTLTLGDGGDRIDISSNTWDVTNGVITSATWNGAAIGLAYGGMGVDVSGYSNGLFGLNGGTMTDIDTESELETALGGLDVLTVTTGDITSANLATMLTDETGTGSVVFSDSPTFTGAANFAGLIASNSTTTGSAYFGSDLTVAGEFVSKGVTWTSRTSAADNSWRSVTYGNGLFVAVADSGTGNRVMTSPDGINWTSRTSAADNSWNSVTYGNGMFVAVASSGTGNRVMTSPDGINWTSRTSAADNNWQSITYGNGLFVAVSWNGTGNRVMTSPDGINWTSRTSAANNSWYSVTYGNGLFVAVSTSGTGDYIMTSPDGINWTSRTSAANNSWYSVTYGNGLFVAVSFTGTGNRVMTSPDGINWTSRTSGANNSWRSVTYGNGMFVAVSSDGTGNRVMTSGKIEIGNLAHNNVFQGGMNIFGNVGIGTTTPWRSFTVNGLSDLGTNALAGSFTATGINNIEQTPGGSVPFSDDFNALSETTLASWTPDTGTGWTPIIQTNGVTLRAQTSGRLDVTTSVADSGVLYTADGTYASADYEVKVDINTTDSSDDVMLLAARIQDADNFYAYKFSSSSAFNVLYKKVGGVWTVLGSSSTGVTTSSTLRLRIVGNRISVYLNDTLLVSVVDSDISAAGKAGLGAGNIGQTSSDDADTTWDLDNFTVTNYQIGTGIAGLFNGKVGIGTTNPSAQLEVVGDIISKGTQWISRTSAADNDWISVTYGNGMFVAVSSDGTGNRVMTSPDGINWTSRSIAANNSWRSVTYGNGMFVAVSSDGTGNRVMTSPDGINWTSRTSAANNIWTSVTYGNGLFVAVSNTGTGNRVMTSLDGITWTSRTSAADNSWLSVTYGNGLFVAVSTSGTGNRVMTSPDGINWTSRTSAANNSWRSVTYGNGMFVAVSSDGTGNRVMTSPDGINWTSRTSAADNSWTSVTYGNGLFVAVAWSGTGNRVMTSPDGITWTSRTSAADNVWTSVTYGNGLFVAVSNTGTGNRVMTSGKPDTSSFAHDNIYQGGMNIMGGNVGIGTTSAASLLTIYGSSNWGQMDIVSTDANGEAGLLFKSADDGDGAGWLIGKNLGLTNDQFSISRGGTNQFVIDTSGNVGIGTTSPSGALTLVQPSEDASGGLWITNGGEGAGNSFRSLYADGSGLQFYGGLGFIGFNTATLNNAGEWTNASDVAYKDHVTDLPNGLATALALQPRAYTILGTSIEKVGFIAQEVEMILPQVVSGEDGSKGIAYGNLTAVAIKAIQEMTGALDITAATTTGAASILSLYQGASGDVPALLIDAAGRVAIGTTTPTAQLHTTGTVRFQNFGAGTLQTDANGNLSVSSDERLKVIEGDFSSSGIQALLGIEPIQYRWASSTGYDTETLYTGFSAQNVQEFIPEAVGEDKHGFLTLSDRPILATVINAVKEIWAKLLGHDEKIQELERENQELESRVRVLENALKVDPPAEKEETPPEGGEDVPPEEGEEEPKEEEEVPGEDGEVPPEEDEEVPPEQEEDPEGEDPEAGEDEEGVSADEEEGGSGVGGEDPAP